MASDEAPRNRLGLESSAYLLQHAHQPVHWYPWGVEALADAAATNRPILLSVGYAACHWCHVMAHESFDDPAVADILNAHFISIKVDREERPDIDHLYMMALQALGEQGGWPLTMFLLPTGEPFWGGTYFPPKERWGRPGFATVLRAVLDATIREPSGIAKTTARLGAALRLISQPSPGPLPDPALLDRAAAAIGALSDRRHGGFAGAPKFPNFPAHRFLAQRAARGDEQAATAVDGLLAALCAGGICDHVGGGLFRYSTDVLWLVPHFEKMLYDNAQFVEALALAHTRAPSRMLERHTAAAIAFLQRELAADAVFASSLDADTPAGEGAFYVWTETEIDATLQQASADFKIAFGVTAAGNWEGRSILQHPAGAEPASDFSPELAALAIARDHRPRPARDNKILTDWNSLVIVALCRAASVFGRPAWLKAAEACFATLAERLCPAGRWHHAWGSGRILAHAQLDDVAAIGLAALSLYETTARPEYLNAARAAAEQAEQWHGPAREGYAMTPADAADLPAGLSVRLRSVTCGALPSGSGMMAQLLARLYQLTGDPAFGDRARLVIEAFAGRYDHPLASVTLLAAAEMLEDATVVVICGDPESPHAARLRAAALTSPDPACCVLSLPPDAALPPSHPAHGKRAPDTPLAFVCRRATCLPPVADAAALSSLLRATNPSR